MNIDISYLYNSKDFNGLNLQQLQQKSQELKQRFDYLRMHINNLRTRMPINEQWIKLNNIILDFERGPLQTQNQQWANVYRAPNISNLDHFFKNYLRIHQTFITDIASLNIEESSHSTDVENLKKDMLLKIEEDLISIKNDIYSQIQKGIDDVLNLKSELGLTANFSANLDKVKGNANTLRYVYMSSFIFSLLVISFLIVYISSLSFIKELEVIEKYSVKISSIAILGFLSYFLFNQFKLYQMLHLRYTHLSNFLGGGATYIGQIIGNDGDVKKKTNQKLADMFMEVDDALGMVKKMQHPTDATIGNTNKVLGNILEKLVDITKNISEIKKE